jgi:GNAT superfamily N-acetyltransferase
MPGVPGEVTEPPFAPPVLLTAAHDASSFESGEPVLDDWLRRRALANQANADSRSYVVCPAGSPRIAGFYALSMGQILAQDVTAAQRRNMPSAIPSILLGRLAVDGTWHGQGLGRAMLADAVQRSLRASTEISARLVIVHAISPAAEAFYAHHGFTRLPTETPTLALDLVKFSRLAGSV